MEFALYKGDKLLCIGSIEDIAKKTNVECKTVKYYGTNSYKKKLAKRNTTNAKILIKLDDEN